jgi:hypothetical protein
MKTAKPKMSAEQAEHLAGWIDNVAALMHALSDQMKYYGKNYGGHNGRLVKHAREMAGAVRLMKGWAKVIRERVKT